MTRKTLDLAPPSPNFRTTPEGGRLTPYEPATSLMHDGSSVESGFEPGILRDRSRDLTVVSVSLRRFNPTHIGTIIRISVELLK
ncbi:hypothetical protein AVEN_15477-1 [Araneus ventricosus]|uniref:Uncharacterized protein n=1 Tax=Araneus ventricosus TaxID=182803 RepID=A0A4Y2VEE8_ARAVE|nr:hypothetical protein AVEN_15477-1 [Araneus ventricosus]